MGIGLPVPIFYKGFTTISNRRGYGFLWITRKDQKG